MDAFILEGFLNRAIGAELVRAFVNRMAQFTDRITKIPSKILICKKDAKITILYGYIAGEQVNEIIETQARNGGCIFRFIIRGSVIIGHNMILCKF